MEDGLETQEVEAGRSRRKVLQQLRAGIEGAAGQEAKDSENEELAEPRLIRWG